MTAIASSNFEFRVPGPTPSPILGSLGNTLAFGKDPIGYVSPLFDTYGPVVSLAAGGGTNIYSPLPNCPGTVFVYGPELVKQVTSQHEVYYKYPLTGKFYRKKDASPRSKPLKNFGVGLFGVNGQEHLQNRRLMMPAFHKQRLDTYHNEMVAITQSELEQMVIGQSYNIAQVMRELTLKIVTKTLFGEDLGPDGTNSGTLLQGILAVQGLPLLRLFPFDIPGLPYHRYLNLMAQYEERMGEIIAKKRAKAVTEPDVLSMLIEARDEESGLGLSEEELLGHTGVLFAAGHGTSAHALTWTLFLLSQHPQITADLVDELEAVLQGSPPTLEQLSQLPLLERVVKESLRIITPVPWNGRVTSQATEIGGYSLPAGTEVFVSIYHTHHMKEIYPEPEEFRPERWETIEPNSYEYNPFSAGPRICIGAAFAKMEIKIVLAMLLQRFRLQFLPQTEIDRSGIIVLQSKNGMPMLVHSQDHQFSQGVGGVRGNVREMVNLPK